MGQFVFKQTPSGGFTFVLKAGNGQVVAQSQVYKTRKTLKTGVASVKKNASAAQVEDQTKEGFETLKNPKFEVYADKKGEFRFRLKAANGQTVLTGEGYSALRSCMNGIESVRKNAPDAELAEAE